MKAYIFGFYRRMRERKKVIIKNKLFNKCNKKKRNRDEGREEKVHFNTYLQLMFYLVCPVDFLIRKLYFV